MKYRLIIFLFVMTAFGLSGCRKAFKKSGCDAAIGYWVTEKIPEELGAFKIYKDGDIYIFQGIGHSEFGKDYKSGLSCENDKLVLKGIPFLGNLEFTVLNNGQNILVLGKDFVKQDDGSSSIVQNTLSATELSSLRKLHGSQFRDDLLENPIVKKRLNKLLGDERFSFMYGNWSIGTPVKIVDDVLVMTGCMSHFCMEKNFIVIIDLTKNTFHAGIRDNDQVTTYSESGSIKTKWIQQRMQHWIEYGSD